MDCAAQQTPDVPAVAAPARLPTPYFHYFDAVRAVLMLAGVPYHVARIYAGGRENTVNSPESSAALFWFSEFLHSFRMEAFFAVAGFFSYLILTRGTTGAWLRERTVRLGIPLLFCTLTLAPLATGATVFADIQHGELAAGDFLAEWQHRMLASSQAWVFHLWFLHSLVILTLVFAALRDLNETRPLHGIEALADNVAARFCAIPGLAGGLLLAFAAFLFWVAGYALEGPLDVPLDPFGEAFSLRRPLQLLPFFLIGAVMARLPACHGWATARSRSAPVIATAAAVAYTVLVAHGDALDHRLVLLGTALLACIAGVFWLRTLLGFAARRMSSHNPLVRYVSNASYTVYLVHLPIALWLGAWAIGIGAPPLVEFLVIVALTLAASFAAHEVIRRTTLLSLLFNGIDPARHRRKRTA